METDRNVLRRHAMLLGTYMGVFWIVKFALFPMGVRTSFLMLLFVVLTCCVPFMGYRYLRLFRDQACGGVIGFGRAWWFTVLMYLFASLLTAAGHYVYFAFIDGGRLVVALQEMWQEAVEQDLPGVALYAETMEASFEQIGQLSPIDIVVQLFCQNMYFCIFLAIPTALLAMRRGPKELKREN